MRTQSKANIYSFKVSCNITRENNILTNILTNQIYQDYYGHLEIKEKIDQYELQLQTLINTMLQML